MKIYLINLKQNRNRLEYFFDHLPRCWQKNDINIFEAINGDNIDIPSWFEVPNGLNGRYGCYLSHFPIQQYGHIRKN
jgi:GR25 family glycosyltransferase involved in LPS biosynthesis